jgi:hypothetical protein
MNNRKIILHRPIINIGKPIKINPKKPPYLLDWVPNEYNFRNVYLILPSGVYEKVLEYGFKEIFCKCLIKNNSKQYKLPNSYRVVVNRKSIEFFQLITNLDAHKIKYKIQFLNHIYELGL